MMSTGGAHISTGDRTDDPQGTAGKVDHVNEPAPPSRCTIVAGQDSECVCAYRPGCAAPEISGGA